MQQNSLSARLASKLNALYRKIFDKKLEQSGILSDVIHVKTTRTTTLDIAGREIIGIDLINVIFPRLEDVPMRKITNTSGETRNAIYANAGQPFLLYAPINTAVDIDDLIIKLYDDVTADNTPWVTILQIKDTLGTFGDRSIIYQKIQCTYFDESLPTAIVDYVTTMANRRKMEELNW